MVDRVICPIRRKTFVLKDAEQSLDKLNNLLRYDTRCYFNVRSKADISQLNLPHGTDN